MDTSAKKILFARLGCHRLYFLTSGHSDAHPWASECPDVKNYKWRLNSVWHRMLPHGKAAKVGVKGLTLQSVAFGVCSPQ